MGARGPGYNLSAVSPGSTLSPRPRQPPPRVSCAEVAARFPPEERGGHCSHLPWGLQVPRVLRVTVTEVVLTTLPFPSRWRSGIQ